MSASVQTMKSEVFVDGQRYQLQPEPLGKGGHSTVYAAYPVPAPNDAKEYPPLAIKIHHRQPPPLQNYRLHVVDSLENIRRRQKNTLYLCRKGYCAFDWPNIGWHKSFLSEIPFNLTTQEDEDKNELKNFIANIFRNALYKEYSAETEKQNTLFDSAIHTLEDGRIVISMLLLPGKPLYQQLGELAQLSFSQRLTLAALAAQTVTEFHANRGRIYRNRQGLKQKDLHQANLLIHIEHDQRTGAAHLQCNMIDFCDPSISFEIAAPEWNRHIADCTLVLMCNREDIEKIDTNEHLVILTNDNCAHFVIDGILEEYIVKNIDRQGLEPCQENFQQVDDELVAFRIITEATLKSRLPLGNHHSKMETYALTAIIAMILGGHDVFLEKISVINRDKSHEENYIAAQNQLFRLDSAIDFISEEATKLGLSLETIQPVIDRLIEMGDPDPAKRPEDLEIVKTLNTAALQCREAEIKQNARIITLARTISENSKFSSKTAQRILNRLEQGHGYRSDSISEELCTLAQNAITRARENQAHSFRFFHTDSTESYQKILECLNPAEHQAKTLIN